MFNKQEPYQEGINAYLTLMYASPIQALSNNLNKFGKEDRFVFAKGFWYAHEFLSK